MRILKWATSILKSLYKLFIMLQTEEQKQKP